MTRRAGSVDDVAWAVAFLLVVSLMMVVGVVIGMIVAGRIDGLQAPRPRRPADEPSVGDETSAGAPPAADEEEQT